MDACRYVFVSLRGAVIMNPVASTSVPLVEIEIEVVHTRVGILYVASQVGGRVLTRDFGGQPCRGHLGPPKPKSPPPLQC